MNNLRKPMTYAHGKMPQKLNCLGVPENTIDLEKENTYPTQSVVDNRLEYIDPTPSIHDLFVQFDARFFWNILTSVEVKWSNRMTNYNKHMKHCTISLSAPLLKLRPRKDLVETLLHEMIHAYLFLTNNNRDRSDHGPNFCEHMHRINREAGTNITIFHEFHNEVKLYQQHWWKCNGPCQHKPPFFGTVRRSMNRAPGPSDFWWNKHQQDCNGKFIKIKEPENLKSHSKKNKLKSKNQETPCITNWLTKNATDAAAKPSSSKVSLTQSDSKILTQRNNDMPSTSRDNNDGTNSFHAVNEKNTQDLSLGMKKLGGSSNKVNGWGTSGPSGKVEKDTSKSISKNPTFSCSGVLGGSNSGQSNLLTKFNYVSNDENHRRESTRKNSLEPSSTVRQERSANSSVSNQPRHNSIPCPVCNVPMTLENLYRHVDSCLINDNTLIDEINNNINNNNNNNNEELMLPIRASTMEENNDVNTINNTNTISNKRPRLDNPDEMAEYVNCPVCNRPLPSADINQHLDKCLLEADTIHQAAIPSTSRASFDDAAIPSTSRASFDDSIITINNSIYDLKESVIESHSIINEIPPETQSHEKTSSDEGNATDHEQKCLVCNKQIPPGISLNEHLEECIKNFFNDDIMKINENDKNDDDDDMPVEINSMESKYHCPVCMEVISENLMNQHLDTCLKND
ncbi:sprT-like domain-containing protein Spartan isoform X2 [Nylanderia fulva]|uniref:sprT-like domain-containing protein Spartan isoform X2 n=1 Tax=Nylanderia fulva TaxID=613905 RepID=UPI0010FAD531|nr:sprT-like domain-containing protein Spartan isoform X2 [Nylanderia fulva]